MHLINISYNSTIYYNCLRSEQALNKYSSNYTVHVTTRKGSKEECTI